MAADELTEQEKQEAAELLREESKDLATSIGLMKERNKAMEGIIDVEKDIKKDRRTLSTDIGNQVTSVQESMMGGVEGFVSETFGPLGGFVNLFTMGFIRRRMENAKLETENVKATKKQNESVIKQNAKTFIEGYILTVAHFSWCNGTRWTFGSFKVE